MLLAKGAETGVIDNSGKIAIVYAAALDLRDNDGKTARDLASLGGAAETIRILERAGSGRAAFRRSYISPR